MFEKRPFNLNNVPVENDQREPGAFEPAHERITDPDLAEIGFAVPATTPQRLEAMPPQGQESSGLASMHSTYGYRR